MIPGKNTISTFFTALVLSFLTASCQGLNTGNYPGEQFSFSCGQFHCALSTPNGAWFKAQPEDFAHGMLNALSENGEVFRISRAPGMDERILILKLKEQNKLAYDYLNYISIKVTDLQHALTETQAEKLIRLPSARASEMNAYRKVLKNFRKIFSGDTMLSGSPAWETEVQGNHKDILDAPAHIKTLYFIKGRNLIRIKGVCLETNARPFLADYDKMVKSLTLTPI